MNQRKKLSNFCKLHNSRAIQIGSCLTCTSAATICQTKGCIKHHQQNQRVHNIHTIEYVKHVVHQYVNSDLSKKQYLKKMVSDYFTAAKKQLQKLYNNIYEAIDKFKFDSVVLHNEERRIAELLIEQRYGQISCSDIANVLPKLIKCTNFQDGHFIHLRNYLRMEKEKLPNLINTMILNLPYFREYDKNSLMSKFCEISDSSLKEVNRKLAALNYRPKKVRIKYSNFELTQIICLNSKDQEDGQDDDTISTLLQNFQKQLDIQFKRQFVKLVSTLENLNDIQNLEFYCIWNIDNDDYQVAFFEALTKFSFLTNVAVFTGFKVTSTDFIEDIFQEKNIQVRIYKKEWHF